ncbi:MAG: VOC family protein [candidate division Zixibacteria bacterium]|nr:VOC family protein [candidate division Zixibacteria bacterium]
MTPLASLVPMLHVKSVPRSVEFYKKMGFEVGNTFTPSGQKEPSWAWLKSGGAHLMVTRADGPVDARAVVLYIYCEDVSTFRAELQKNGVTIGEIEYPFYAPRGEFRVKDPDGYCLMITHTG